MVVWTFRDMRERTHDGWSQAVAMLLVGLFSIAGLVLYLLLRPHETLAEAYERRFEAEMLVRDAPEPRRACPRCERPANGDFLFCPYCRTSLREPCSSCERPLELDWAVCPYCGTQSPRTAVPTPARVASEPPVPTEAQARPSPAPRRAARSPAARSQRSGTSGRSST